MTTYSIGTPENPTPEDQRFLSFDEAEMISHSKSDDGHVWCVWDDSDGSIEFLVFQGVSYF